MASHFLATSLFLLLIVVEESSVLGQHLEYLGCYDLSYALNQAMHTRMPMVALPTCVLFCTGKGRTQIGIEKSDHFCYCGDDIAEESTKKPDELCSVPCADNYDNYTCGGDWLMSVYRLAKPTTTISVAHTADTQPGKISDDGVGFMVGYEDGARLYKSNSISTYETLLTESNIFSVDYHYSKGWAFERSKSHLFRSPLIGQTKDTPKVIIKAIAGSCEAFAVDWVEDRIYYAECPESRVTILSMDLDGNNVTKLLDRSGDSASVRRMQIDPFKRQLFWTADGTVETCDLSGQNYKGKLSPEGISVRGLALDLEAQRVYFIGAGSYSAGLHSMDYQGHNHTLLYSTLQMRSVYGMGVLKESVYWLNFANLNDIIYKGPKQSTTGTADVQLITNIRETVWDLRLVHPDLQKLPNKNLTEMTTESIRTTSELISTAAVTTASTSSPPQNATLRTTSTTEKVDAVTSSPSTVKTVTSDPTLTPAEGNVASKEADSTKGTHHASAEASSSSMSTVLLVVFLIVVGIVVLASLAFFGDRYWSTIRGKILRVSYQREIAREEDETPRYHRQKSEDNVRLI